MTNEEREKLLGDVNRGTAAAALFPLLVPIMEDVRLQALARFKQMYRSGIATEGMMLAVAAELCTIEDIENRFKSKIRRGEGASGELNGSGE